MTLARSMGDQGSLDSLNTRPIGRPIQDRSKVTPFGRIRRLQNIPTSQKAFFILGVIAAAVSVGTTVYRLTELDKGSQHWVLAWVVIINSGFSLWYLLVALLFEQYSDMLCFVVSKSGGLLYVLIHYILSDQDLGTHIGAADLTTLVFDALFWAIMAPWGARLAYKFHNDNVLMFCTVKQWKEDIVAGCKRLHVIHSLLKLNMQIEFSLVVLAAESGFKNISVVDAVILICGPAFILATRVTAHSALKYEMSTLAYLYLFFSLFELTFIGSELRAIGFPSITMAMRGAVIAVGSVGIVVQLIINILVLMYVRNVFGIGVKRDVFNIPDDTVLSDEPDVGDDNNGANFFENPV